MASAISTISQRQQPSVQLRAMSKQAGGLSKAEVIFVPWLVDLGTPIRKASGALQLRRQLVDLFSGFVSGAVSIR